MRKLLYGIGAVFVLLIAIRFALPQSSRVEETATINASAATVFAQLNDFRRFSLWAPFAELDPNVRILYSGERRGVGSTMTWDGAVAGSGTQTITASRPFERVDIVTNRGESGEATTWFALAEEAGVTTVSWGFETDYGMNVVGWYFAPFFSGILAREYQSGLARLKELAEGLPEADFSDLEIEQLIVEASEIAYIRTTSAAVPGAISDAMGKSYFEILNFIDEHGLEDAGAPLSIIGTYSGSELVFDTAIPVRNVMESTPREGPAVRLGYTYAGPVLRIKHVGSYRTLSETHRKIASYLAAHGMARNGPAWESYVSDPGSVAETELITNVYYPIKLD